MNLYNKPVHSLYLSYVIPTLIGAISSSIYCLVDVYFISKGSGSVGLAALNIAMPVFTIYSCIGLLFGVGGATIMAIAEGSKDDGTRNKSFTLSCVVLLIIGVIMSVVGTVWVEPFAKILGSNEEILPYVKDYMLPINMSAFSFIFMHASSILIRADHSPKTAMFSLMIGNISNIFLDYLFVMVFHMGILGASIATALSPIITLSCIAIYFIRKKNKVRFIKDFYSIDLLKRIVSSGLGTGILELSTGFVIIVFNIIILAISNETALAAYAIITNIAYVLKGLLTGLAQAGQPILSANFGAGYKERVYKALKITLLYSVVFSLLTYVCFLFFPKSIVAVFSQGDEELIYVSAIGLRLYFSSLVFMAINSMMMNYYQSIEQGKIATGIAFLKGIVFIIIALAILVPLFGLSGVWLCVLFAEGICSLLIWYFHRRTNRIILMDQR